MRSTRPPLDDLTARARIRDSAIVYFGRHGFTSATVRAIAADASVSPALVLHHFGSKDGLRAACDSYFTESIDELTDHASAHLGAQDLLDQMARTPQLAPLVPYLIATMADGGEFARKLWDRLVVDTESYLGAAVAGGVIRPTGDERTRAEILTVLKVGMYTLARYVMPPASADRSPPPPGSPPAVDDAPVELDVTAIAAKFTVPMLELFTHGMFTTSEYLDAFVEHQRSTAPTDAPAPPPAQKGTAP